MAITFKNLAFLSLATAMAFTSHSQDMSKSVVTVTELLRLDNEQSLIKAKEDAIKIGIIAAPSGIDKNTPPPPPPKWTVKSIYGTGPNTEADIYVGLNQGIGLRVGSTMGNCTIQAIRNSCVQLTSLPTKGKRKATALQCPSSVCWTGDEIAGELTPNQLAVPQSKSMPSPLPSAPIPLPVGSVGVVNNINARTQN
jgi:hypothetical protein